MKDMYEEILSPVRLYCFRSAQHFGFGVTPDAAFDACKKAGADSRELKLGPKESKGGIMNQLPLGIERYGLDNMGTIHWRFHKSVSTEDMEKPALKMVFVNGSWELKK